LLREEGPEDIMASTSFVLLSGGGKACISLEQGTQKQQHGISFWPSLGHWKTIAYMDKAAIVTYSCDKHLLNPVEF
jgi:hypothetical protein